MEDPTPGNLHASSHAPTVVQRSAYLDYSARRRRPIILLPHCSRAHHSDALPASSGRVSLPYMSVLLRRLFLPWPSECAWGLWPSDARDCHTSRIGRCVTPCLPSAHEGVHRSRYCCFPCPHHKPQAPHKETDACVLARSLGHTLPITDQPRAISNIRSKVSQDSTLVLGMAVCPTHLFARSLGIVRHRENNASFRRDLCER